MQDSNNNPEQCQEPKDYPLIGIGHESLKICNRSVAYIIQNFFD